MVGWVPWVWVVNSFVCLGVHSSFLIFEFDLVTFATGCGFGSLLLLMVCYSFGLDYFVVLLLWVSLL